MSRRNLIVVNVVIVTALALIAVATFIIVDQKKSGRRRQGHERMIANPAGSGQSVDVGPGLDLGITVPEFDFEAAAGGRFGLADLKGKVWVAEFIFTNCAGVCPTMTEMTRILQEKTAGLEGFEIVSISVDPERDSLQVLRDYGAQYGADPGNWHFLRGSEEEVARVGSGMKMLGDDILTHSPKAALIDREGRLRGLYDGYGPERVADFARLVEDVKALLAEGSGASE